MKAIIEQLHQVFESRVRLGVMALLAVNDALDFNSLKQSLNVTDGNLSSHLTVLERNKFVAVNKKFVGRKPSTSYSATAAGRRAFADHLNALEALIRNSK